LRYRGCRYLVLIVDPDLFSLNGTDVRLDTILVLASVAFIAILGIGTWIGYTMATTPPPKPIEEITSETPTENKTPPGLANKKDFSLFCASAFSP
jgi:hypothetical protein